MLGLALPIGPQPRPKTADRLRRLNRQIRRATEQRDMLDELLSRSNVILEALRERRAEILQRAERSIDAAAPAALDRILDTADAQPAPGDEGEADEGEEEERRQFAALLGWEVNFDPIAQRNAEDETQPGIDYVE